MDGHSCLVHLFPFRTQKLSRHTFWGVLYFVWETQKAVHLYISITSLLSFSLTSLTILFPFNLSLISSKASGCSSTKCDYNEVVELDLTDEFLRKNMEKDLSIKFNSLASKSNKISFSSAYIKGYLKIVN